MKKLLRSLMVSMLACGSSVYAHDQENQALSNDLADLVVHALAAAESSAIDNGAGNEYVVWYVNTEKILETFEWGAEFVEDYRQEFMHLMSLGMLDDQDLRKEKLIQESRQRIVLLQRFLRSQLAPYIRPYAIDNDVDVVVDSYTGSLLYAADHLSLEAVTIDT